MRPEAVREVLLVCMFSLLANAQTVKLEVNFKLTDLE
jgi:hypothetical protein